MSREGIPQFKTLEEEKAYWESKGSFGIEAQREEVREGIANILWDMNGSRGIPTWEHIKTSEHEQCVMEAKNTRIDADYILSYLHSQGVVRKGKLLTFEGEPVGYEVESLI